MTTPQSERPQDRTLDISAMKAIAHPLRIAIYDVLSQHGPQTASSLGAQLGESSGATSYHLRQLAKQGLIREVEGRGTTRERWWERPPGGVSMGSPEILATPSGREAAGFVLREMIARRTRQMQRFFFDDYQDEPAEWQEIGTFSTSNLRLDAEQLGELNAEFSALMQSWVERYRDQEGEGVRPVSVQYIAFPLPKEQRDRS
jgi:DNA-binding transcriptional ArsR family regulator